MVTITPEMLHRLRRSTLFSLFGLCVFVVACIFRSLRSAPRRSPSGPRRRGISTSRSARPAPPSGWALVFHDILVRTKPATGKPTRFTIQTARLSSPPGRFSRRRRPTPSRWRRSGGGSTSPRAGAPGKRGPSSCGSARDVNLGEIPGVRDAIDLPLWLDGQARSPIASASGKLAESTGEVTLNCDNVVIGDGKTPLKVAGNPFLSGGLTLPRVRLDDFGDTSRSTRGWPSC